MNHVSVFKLSKLINYKLYLDSYSSLAPSRLYSYSSRNHHIQFSMHYFNSHPGADPGGVFEVSRPPLQKYIREAKRMMYWYKNTLKCIIS